MDKRGWNTPVGLLLIAIITLSIFSAIASIAPTITGNLVKVKGSEQVTIYQSESVSVNGVVIKLTKLNEDNRAEVTINEKPVILNINEIINKEGLQIKLLEVNNGYGGALDFILILASDLGIKEVGGSSSTGRFELAYGQRLDVGGNIVKVMPAEKGVRIFINDKNRIILVGETANIEDHLVKIESIKDFPEYDFDRVILAIKKPSIEIFSVDGRTFDLAVNDPIEINGKSVMLIRTDSLEEGRATIAVDGVIETVNNYEVEIINDIELKVNNIEDTAEEEFDRALIIIK